MKFSIIVPHYDKAVSDEVFDRGMSCLLGQTCKDFEVFVYHDGPISRPLLMPEDDRFNMRITAQRANDWGHTNRNKGMSEAKGEYILHFNPDNILYSFALQKIIDEAGKSYRHISPSFAPPNDIIVFPIVMRGMQTNGHILWRDTTTLPQNAMIFTGYPAVKNNIDAMQLIMKRSLWASYGGWYDLREDSDGNMYPRFVMENKARYCPEILGEHW
ncbi:MAG: glycosyltransferase [Prochlorococcus sp.]